MKRLSCTKVFALALTGLLCVCAGCFDAAPPLEEKKGELLSALEDVWAKGYVGNSDSCYWVSVLVKYDERLAKLFAEFRDLGFSLEFSKVYRIRDWYVLYLSRHPNRRQRLFCKLGRTSANGNVVYTRFDLRPGEWLNIDDYAPSLCYAPIGQEGHEDGFVKMWDAAHDTVIRVPEGFHGRIQGGCGVFLLRKDEDGGYYRWDAPSGQPPQKWEYELVYEQSRAIYTLAKSSKTGKVYAFAVGLNPIPNSEGACWVGPEAAYKGRNVFGFGRPDTPDRTFYYAWPEDPNTEALSSGTETFAGSRMVFPEDGKLLVLYPDSKDNCDIFEAASGKRQKGD